MRTRTYYRGPDAVVTSELFVWRTSPPKMFAIRDLKKVGIARRVVDRTRPHAPKAAAGSVVLALSVWNVMDSPVLVATVFSAVVVPAVAAATYWRRRTWLWELRATYRGAEVVLYASTDTRVFNQVTRALRRAMEDTDPHLGWDGEAAA